MSDEDYLDIIERAYSGNYVSAPWIETLVADVRRLRERVATLECALSDSTRRELLLDQRRATLEREVESWWNDLNPDEASESDKQLAALLDASRDQGPCPECELLGYRTCDCMEVSDER